MPLRSVQESGHLPITLGILLVFLYLPFLGATNHSVDFQSTSNPDTCLQLSIPLTVLPRTHQSSGEVKQVQVFLNRDLARSNTATVYNGPIRLIVIVDTSISMKQDGGDSLSNVARLTAAFALDSAPSNAKVAVGTFAERLQLSPWVDHATAAQQIISLQTQKPKGATALYSAVMEAALNFGDPEFGDSIYLITDGGENRSPLSEGKVLAYAISRGIRIFTFLVKNRPAKSVEEHNAPQEMEEFSAQTGGMLFDLPWSKEFVSSAEAAILAKDIRYAVGSPLRIDLQLDSPPAKAEKLKLETSLDPKRYTVAYPRRLEPCLPAPQH